LFCVADDFLAEVWQTKGASGFNVR